MNVSVYERDQAGVLAHLREGDFDYLEGIDEVMEADFFRGIAADELLWQLGETYPTPRQKQEVPTWFYVGANLALRLHGQNAFSALPYVVRTGGLLTALGPQMGKRCTSPDGKRFAVHCEGFNDKNDYPRQTPCHPDYVRKLARDTDADRLQAWYNQDVAGLLAQRQAFDAEGTFVGDGSYLFVPDNERYEGSSRLLFDESNHPVREADLTPEQRQRCTWRRCYKMISLLHVRRDQSAFVYAALAVVPGRDNECPVLFDLVDGFVRAVGRGVIKRLILDRGFLDGANISRIKRDHGIDTLIPIKRNLRLYDDLMRRLDHPEVAYREYLPPAPPAPPPAPERPERICKREAARRQRLEQKKLQKPPPPPAETLLKTRVAAINHLSGLESCTVPLHVAINRELYADGHEQVWMLLDTREILDPLAPRQEYALRTDIEERHRQLKCFADLCQFTSTARSLVVNQVVFILLAYSLLQLFLLEHAQRPPNDQTLTTIRRNARPGASRVIVYCGHTFGFFSYAEVLDIVLALEGEARLRARARTRQMLAAEHSFLDEPRRPL